jgi:hypothetical protein
MFTLPPRLRKSGLAVAIHLASLLCSEIKPFFENKLFPSERKLPDEI